MLYTKTNSHLFKCINLRHETIKFLEKNMGKIFSNIKCVCVCLVVFDFLQPHGLQPSRLFHLWNFPGKNPGAGCHFLLQESSPIQGLNLCLLLGRQILNHCTSWEARNINYINFFFFFRLVSQGKLNKSRKNQWDLIKH